MKKEKFEHAELVVIEFQTDDVIMTSDPMDDDSDEYEIIIPNH